MWGCIVYDEVTWKHGYKYFSHFCASNSEWELITGENLSLWVGNWRFEESFEPIVQISRNTVIPNLHIIDKISFQNFFSGSQIIRLGSPIRFDSFWLPVGSLFWLRKYSLFFCLTMTEMVSLHSIRFQRKHFDSITLWEWENGFSLYPSSHGISPSRGKFLLTPVINKIYETYKTLSLASCFIRWDFEKCLAAFVLLQCNPGQQKGSCLSKTLHSGQNRKQH